MQNWKELFSFQLKKPITSRLFSQFPAEAVGMKSSLVKLRWLNRAHAPAISQSWPTGTSLQLPQRWRERSRRALKTVTKPRSLGGCFGFFFVGRKPKRCRKRASGGTCLWVSESCSCPAGYSPRCLQRRDPTAVRFHVNYLVLSLIYRF